MCVYACCAFPHFQLISLKLDTLIAYVPEEVMIYFIFSKYTAYKQKTRKTDLKQSRIASGRKSIRQTRAYCSDLPLEDDITYSFDSSIQVRYLETSCPTCTPLSGRRKGYHTFTFSSIFWTKSTRPTKIWERTSSTSWLHTWSMGNVELGSA